MLGGKMLFWAGDDEDQQCEGLTEVKREVKSEMYIKNKEKKEQGCSKR